MTITPVAPGVWELRTRHGQLIGRGDLYTVITLWARVRREGWSDLPYGQPATSPLSGRRTVECAEAHDCQCRAGSTPARLVAKPAALEPSEQQPLDPL